MRCFSLFSGIGGFDLALRRQDHKIIGACEIDKYARQIYAKYYPTVPIHQDATKINPRDLPDFDILCAGFPCQAFSVAGRRLGFQESRGTLFFEIARIAQQKRPRLLLLENVKGLLFHNKGQTFEQILRVLDEIGYDVQWQVLDTKYFLPQKRERVFIIGHLRGTPRPQIFPITDGNKHSHQTPTETQEERQRFRDQFVGAIDAHYYKGGLGTRTMIVEPPKKIKESKTGVYAIRMGQTTTNGEPTFTMDTTGNLGVYDGKHVRKLTPLECERLQGFPDNYTQGLSDTQRYKCLGNAVSVPVVEFILERLDHETKQLL